MQERNKKPAPEEQPGQAPEFEQVVVPPVDDLLKEMESAMAASRLANDAVREKLAEPLDWGRWGTARVMEEEGRYGYRERYEMERYERRERDYRIAYRDHADRNFSLCNINCPCPPCREGHCRACTGETERPVYEEFKRREYERRLRDYDRRNTDMINLDRTKMWIEPWES